MVTILIKSFNRPHYLDRCLQSICQNVSGEYSIKIVDDGTPGKYLDLIQRKFPQIEILFTESYQEKSQQIENQIVVKRSIPSQDWYKTVQSSTDYILVIEDDVWFTDKVDFDRVVADMQQHLISLLRLGWNGFPAQNQIMKVSDQIIDEQVKVFSLNPYIINLLFANRYKSYSILKKLKIIEPRGFERYYHFISISSGIHRKEYWLKTWENMPNTINEKKQIKNAIAYYKTHRTQNFITRYHKEIIKTTFKSSATNMGHEYGNRLDVNRFNHILNEAWYNGEFDSMENYPKDFSDNYIKQFLDKAKDAHALYEDWINWSEKFKQQYRNLGAQVE